MLESKSMKCKCINLTKYGQYLHTENYKILLREIRELLNKYSLTTSHNIVKMPFSTNYSMDSMQSQTKIAPGIL